MKHPASENDTSATLQRESAPKSEAIGKPGVIKPLRDFGLPRLFSSTVLLAKSRGLEWRFVRFIFNPSISEHREEATFATSASIPWKPRGET